MPDVTQDGITRLATVVVMPTVTPVPPGLQGYAQTVGSA